MPSVSSTAPIRTKEYETIYVLRPDATREVSQSIADRLKDVITKESGRLTRLESWGRRALAYRVQKYRHGIYVYATYVGGGSIVAELERNLRLLDQVIKFQTIIVESEVQMDEVKVDDANVAYEAIEGEPEEEDGSYKARTLGLVERPAPTPAAEEPAEGAETPAEGDAAAPAAPAEGAAAEAPAAETSTAKTDGDES